MDWQQYMANSPYIFKRNRFSNCPYTNVFCISKLSISAFQTKLVPIFLNPTLPCMSCIIFFYNFCPIYSCSQTRKLTFNYQSLINQPNSPIVIANCWAADIRTAISSHRELSVPMQAHQNVGMASWGLKAACQSKIISWIYWALFNWKIFANE